MKIQIKALDILAGVVLVCMTALLLAGMDGEIKATFLVLAGYIVRAAVPLVMTGNAGGRSK